MTRREEAAAEADYYTLLRVLPPPSPLPAQLLRKAYHAALLLHHPDKASSHRASIATTTITPTNATTVATTTGSAATTVSVDAITQAYRTLSSPELRAAYDRSLATGMRTGPGGHSGGSGSGGGSGSEVVQTADLDEFEYIPQGPPRYVRSCRCGEQEGFVLSEDELERALSEGCGGDGRGGGNGEVVVGCCGCSLWCRVEFCVDDGGA